MQNKLKAIYMKFTKSKDSKVLLALIEHRNQLIEQTANLTAIILDQIAINVDALKRIDNDIEYITGINDEFVAVEKN